MKRVPAPGARINITADGQAVDTAFLGFTTSPHEECAVEAAVQLVEQHGGEVTVLTLGPAEAEEQLRYAASVGVTNAVLLATDGSDWDPQRTAQAITSAVRELEATDGPFDLILFGNESADSGGFQVGIRVAHALGRPIVNGAKGISVDDGGAEMLARVRCRPRGLRAAAARRRRRQGGDQPAPLPDDEGPAGVEEGPDRERDRGRRSPAASRWCGCGRRPSRRRRPSCSASGVDAVPAVVDLLESDRGAVKSILVVVEHDRGTLAPAALEGVTAAARLAAQRDDTVEALTIGVAADALAAELATLRRRLPSIRPTTRCSATTDPRRGARSWPRRRARSHPAAVVATGTDRGNEVLAQAAARLDAADGRQLHRVRRPATRSR